VGPGPVVSLCHAGRRLMPRRVRALIDHLVHGSATWTSRR
jgi:hypothetical protein